jgi:hypothetical protein
MKQTYCALLLGLSLIPSRAIADANVTVVVSNQLSTVATTAFGIHTSVYDNQNGNAALPGRLIQSGVNTLRYSGGGYADVYHWSVHKLSPWGWDGTYGYLGPNTDFGKFVQLLDASSCQAVITINFGSALKWNAGKTQLIAPATNGLPQEAAAWVAYANADGALYGTTNDIVIGFDALTNDWKTVGFWAKLRSSTVVQYQSWAGTNYDATYNFLAINHPTPVGIKYWEIGNETFGTGYYDGGEGYSVNYAVPYDGTSRLGHTNLSPATYGQKVKQFSELMKAVDPTIKIGAVVSTPPGDYSWDIFNGQRWSSQVLQQCATNVDFIIAHWYPYIGEGSNGSNLFAFVRSTLPVMVNGATTNLDINTSAGLRDWIATYWPGGSGSNIQMFITEFNYFGSITNANRGPGNAVFTADSYATWMDLGVANIDYLEMNKTPFVGDSGSLTRGAAYYAIQMVRKMAGPGDSLLTTTSDQTLVRAHASLRQDGKLGLLLINESLTTNQTVNVSIPNISLSTSGTRHQFGTNNFPVNNETPSSGPSSNNISGLGNSFAVSVPACTMVVLTIPVLTNTAPTLAPISDQTVNVGQAVAFTASGNDTDIPAQTLTYSLLSGPTNVTLDSATEAFFLRPLVTQSGSTNNISIRVADNGSPSLSATQNFTVTVHALQPPLVTYVAETNGSFVLNVNGQAGPDYALQTSTNLLDWDLIFTTNSPSMPFAVSDVDTPQFPLRFYRILVGPPLP